MTQGEEEYNAILLLISGMTPAQILSYGEVYAFFREEFNNEMIDIIEKNPTLKLFYETIKDNDIYGTRKFEDNFIVPLGKYINDNSALTYIDYDGPFGLNTNFSMNFHDEIGNELSFSFHRKRLNGTELSVWTKKKKESKLTFKSGTIGAMNQGNLESEIIPSNITIENLISKYIEKDDC